MKDSEYGIGTSLAQPRMTMTGGNVHSMSGCRSFVRNASVSSQGSLEGGGSSSSGAHRGSCSPRIRAFGPDGRHRQPESFPTASSYPPSRSSRLLRHNITLRETIEITISNHNFLLFGIDAFKKFMSRLIRSKFYYKKNFIRICRRFSSLN